MSKPLSLLESLRQEPGQLGTAWDKLTEAAKKELDEVVAACVAGELCGLSVAKIFSSFTEAHPKHKMSEMTFRRMWKERLRYHKDRPTKKAERNAR